MIDKEKDKISESTTKLVLTVGLFTGSATGYLGIIWAKRRVIGRLKDWLHYSIGKATSDFFRSNSVPEKFRNNVDALISQKPYSRNSETFKEYLADVINSTEQQWKPFVERLKSAEQSTLVAIKETTFKERLGIIGVTVTVALGAAYATHKLLSIRTSYVEKVLESRKVVQSTDKTHGI